MSIHKIGSDLVRPFGPKGSSSVERKSDGEAKEGPKRAERNDQVGFSQEGLALAELIRNVEADLSAERVAEIEQRIASGFYDDPDIAEEVARRLVASGDLGQIG